MSKPDAERALSIIKRQRDVLGTIKESLDSRLPQWRDRTVRFLRDIVVNDELRILSQINGGSWEEEKVLFFHFMQELETGINEVPEQYLSSKTPLDKEEDKKQTNDTGSKRKSNKVFIVHGHDSLSKTEVARTLEKLGLEAIVLHEQPNEGKTIIEKFERDASQVGFAVILLTPDDIGYPKNKPDSKRARARQNVILELGFFCGALGRSNVCVLFKGNTEIPSDYLGVVYVSMDDGGAWRFNLAKELKQAGITVDLNNLV